MTEASYAKDQYVEEKMRDQGHIREMVTALEENTERLIKAMEGLGSAIEPVLRPSDEGTPEDGLATPAPIRCALADDLARINDKLYRTVERIQRKRERIDI